MKGILLSLGILIPTILPSQIRLVPFPGIFSTYIGAHLSKRQFCLRPLSRGFFSIVIGNSLTVSRTSFRPLSRGPFFNQQLQKQKMENTTSLRPLSWGLFSISPIGEHSHGHELQVFVPFLEDFFSIPFRSRSSGVSSEDVFVPFLGDLFSITTLTQAQKFTMGVSSPFLGNFFQLQILLRGESKRHPVVFVPFLGDLFSIIKEHVVSMLSASFRPLSRGPFFNRRRRRVLQGVCSVFVPFLGDLFSMRNLAWEVRQVVNAFSSPFSGTFFQLLKSANLLKSAKRVFVPFLGDLFSISIMATNEKIGGLFSSPFSGTFFQLV